MPKSLHATLIWLAQLGSCLVAMTGLIAAALAMAGLLILLLLAPLWNLLRALWGARRRAASRLRKALALSCLCALSGCGTLVSQVETCPRVPAALLLPPAKPVLLAPPGQALGLKTPGQTTPSTPPPAPLTAPATQR
ncbi:MAG: hypothetical protein AB7I35_12195 [Ramlibacter sp.]